MLAILIIILLGGASTAIGYNLFLGGKEIPNESIKVAGLILTVVSVIATILSLKAGYDASSSIKDMKQRLHQNTRPANAVETVEEEAVEYEVVEDNIFD